MKKEKSKKRNPVKKYKKKIALVLFLIFLIWYIFCLPSSLFKQSTCTVLEDKKGNLLGARIAKDGQWRFPYNKKVPEKFKQAITHFEDSRFYYHWGFDIISLFRATWQNIKNSRIVSGGSTLTMQVIRMSRNSPRRTFSEKFLEIILATRLEFSYSKDEILALYASNAPFGGNVVGLDAASWRYFGRDSEKLSWAESAMLAVLPNSPALIHIGRNRNALLRKRNRLLKKLKDEKIISQEMYELSIDEPIAAKPKPFPQKTPHLLDRVSKEHSTKKTKIKTTINIKLQEKVNYIIQNHYKYLKTNEIHNVAVLVLDVESGNTLAYAGNISNSSNKKHGQQVDVITSARSTGSILKPFLYAAMLTSGEILPNALVPDIPTTISGYAPRNYNRSFDGAVLAHRALARSLNIPAVLMLQKYGVERFHYLLNKLKMTTVKNAPSHYGLSLILGGCEGKLWELTGIYASMARSLNNFSENSGRYNSEDYFQPKYFYKNTKRKKKKLTELSENSIFSASAIYLTFDAMLNVERPPEESNWQIFASSNKIAWKTGTSFGFRDAWAIGVTPKYAVGVWVGNADGEGRPNLVGIKTAAPILFDIYKILPLDKQWFEPPYDDMIQVATCHESGYLSSPNCNKFDTIWIPTSGERFKTCPYHQIIHLDKNEEFRVHSNCEDISQMKHKSWFVLPPAMEWYFKSKNSTYKTLPPYRSDCLANLNLKNNQTMEIIYPHFSSQIYVPIELDGKTGNAVFEAAHRKPETTIFWHIDDDYIGQTKDFHRMAVCPKKGKHTLTIIDETGEKMTCKFEVISK